MAKITDKERLDWLLTRVIVYSDGKWERDPVPQFTTQEEKLARAESLDAAIRAERKPKGDK